MTDRAAARRRRRRARQRRAAHRGGGGRYAVDGAVHRRRRARTARASRSVRRAHARESRRLSHRRRGRQPFRLRRLEHRPRQAGDAARARAAGRGRQVRARAPGCCASRAPAAFRASCTGHCSNGRASTRWPPPDASACTTRHPSYAARFCRRVAALLERKRHGVTRDLMAELRRFYRWGNVRKLRHIERYA